MRNSLPASHSKYENWRNQFILSQKPVLIPGTWLLRSFERWSLGTHPGLPVVRLVSKAESLIGWILGWPIDIETERILASDEKYVLSGEDEKIFDLGGRWLAILADRSRVYTDPTAGVGAVYSTSHRIVASSTGLLPPGDIDSTHEQLVKTLDIPSMNNWYAFGLTAHSGARRILPNHCLDISTFSHTRIWPHPGTSIKSHSSEAVDSIISIGRAQIRALAKQYKLKGNLTAGRDTRMVLALAREYRQELALLTRANRAYRDRLDSTVAARIAADVNLDLTLIRDEAPTERQLEDWQERVGRCVAGAVWRSVATWKQSDPNRVNITGMVGGLGRAFYKTRSDLSELTGEDLCEILALPRQDLVAKEGERWLSGLLSESYLSKRQVLDLLYVEQRVGCWGSPTMYGNDDNAPTIWLVSHRRIVESALGMPETYKVQGKLQHDVIARTWPALLKYPFNRPDGIKDWQLHLMSLKRRIYSLVHPQLKRLPHIS